MIQALQNIFKTGTFQCRVMLKPFFAMAVIFFRFFVWDKTMIPMTKSYTTRHSLATKQASNGEL
jgi:hypothetical protein